MLNVVQVEGLSEVPKKLSAAERQQKADRAVELSAKGWTNTEIAEDIGVHRNTVGRLIDDELANRAEHREADRERAIAVYQAVIREGWHRLRTIKDGSLNVSGVLNSIRSAQDSINKITGAEAPQKHKHEVDVGAPLSDEDLQFLDAVEEYANGDPSEATGEGS